ncbi:hypothetical protein Shyhy02_25690 [Streptomyces hygroscopicus subsp. hygroscopicus]|nr:hypothetical protein Shyhy02_25690 [Streptomyces hygroscopicus subsp. hygroscopicus]
MSIRHLTVIDGTGSAPRSGMDVTIATGPFLRAARRTRRTRIRDPGSGIRDPRRLTPAREAQSRTGPPPPGSPPDTDLIL